MKKIVAALLFIMISGPLPSQNQSLEEVQDLFALICECKNRKDLTVDQYADQEGIELDHLNSSANRDVSKIINNKNSWLYREFLNDSHYLDEIKKNVSKAYIRLHELDKENPEQKDSKSEIDNMIKDLEYQYPVCCAILPVFLAMAF